MWRSNMAQKWQLPFCPYFVIYLLYSRIIDSGIGIYRHFQLPYLIENVSEVKPRFYGSASRN